MLKRLEGSPTLGVCINLRRIVLRLGTSAAYVSVAMRPYGLAWRLVVASTLLLLVYGVVVGGLAYVGAVLLLCLL